ncbi:MAG: CBS domain-containing protein [Bdellovibrionales bacterium]|nr:CBS domain-containing protein [Bdellovibrionales bacterium]
MISPTEVIQVNTIKDIMSPAPIIIPADADVDEVERIFVQNRITTAPVIYGFDQILGVLSDFKLVKIFLRRASLMKSTNQKQYVVGYFSDEFDPVVTIDQDAPIADVFKLIIQSSNHRVFATNNGKLCGVLSPKDLLPYLSGDRKNSSEQKSESKIQQVLTELQQTKDKLLSFTEFFDLAPYPMHSAGFDGKILMANRMMHSILGYAPGELVNKSVFDIYPYMYTKEIEKSLEIIRTVGYNPVISTMLVKKDRSTLKADVATVLRRDENGIPHSTISVTRVTENINLMDFLRHAARDIDRVAAARKA